MERVYHYTNMSAFLSLLESIEKSSKKDSFKFQASSIFFLNDPLEFVYGQEVLMNTLEEIEYEKEVSHDIRLSDFVRNYSKKGRDLLTVIRNNIQAQYESPYILSFSRNEDSLPMWLNYADNGRGICLAFREYESKMIVDRADEKSISDAKIEIFDCLGTHDVNYDSESLLRHDNILRRTIDYIYSDYYLKKVESIHKRDFLDLQIGAISGLTQITAPYIKTKDWSYEKEVRMAKSIKYDKGNNVSEIKFRCNSKGNIVPFIDVEIPVKKLDFVKIGPLANKELTTKALEMVKHRYNLHCKIRNSNVHYQNY